MKIRFISIEILLLFIFSFVFTGCKKEKQLQLKFLDEYIIKDSLVFQNQVVGGLSGINYDGKHFYFVVDDAKSPRILKAKIRIKEDTIQSVDFLKVIPIEKTKDSFFNRNALDLEDLFFDQNTNRFYLVSEGSINYKILPSIFTVDENGVFSRQFSIPKNWSNVENFKHNGTFEALSESEDKKGFWVATEAPLSSDGEEPSFTQSISPIRITYFNKKLQKATHQYAYYLDHITKPAKGETNLNGVTAILSYKKDEFFVLERAYQSGYGSFGNTINLYHAKIDSNSTNILAIDSLENTKYQPLEKTLLFSFDDVKNKLIEGFVDNLEGMTLGPKLPNGNPTLLIVSDDNFQLYGKQLNQLILLEIQ